MTDDNGDGIITARELQARIDAVAGRGVSTILLPGSLAYRLEQTIFLPRGVSLEGESAENPPVLQPNNERLSFKRWANEVAGVLSGFAHTDLFPIDARAYAQGIVAHEDPEVVAAAVEAIYRFLEASGVLEPLERTGRHTWIPYDNAGNYRLEETRFDIFNYAMICQSPTRAVEQRCTKGQITTIGARSVTLAHANILTNPGFDLLDLGAGSPIIQISDNLNEGLRPEPDLMAVYGDLEKLLGAPVTELRNVRIRCAQPPLYPIRGKPVQGAGDWRAGAGFWAMGVAVQAASQVRVSNVDIDGCTIGIYSYGSAYLVLENNKVRTGLPEGFLDEDRPGVGDFAARPGFRYQGLNAMRLHGPFDHDLLVRWNEIGEAEGDRRRPFRGIHLHGSVLAARTNGSGEVIQPPPLLTEQAKVDYVNHFRGSTDELRIARRNVWIYANVVHGALEVGVDIRADQANVVIAGNEIRNVSASLRATEDQAGIKLQSEVSPADSFKSGFKFYARNVLIEGNSIADSTRGIQVAGIYHRAGTYNAFQKLPLASLVTTCMDTAVGCGSAVRIAHNSIARTKGPGLYITNSARVRVTQNVFEDVFPVPDPVDEARSNRNIIRQVDSTDIYYGPNSVTSTASRKTQDQKHLKSRKNYRSVIIRADGGGALYHQTGFADWLPQPDLFLSKGFTTELTWTGTPPSTQVVSGEPAFQVFW